MLKQGVLVEITMKFDDWYPYSIQVIFESIRVLW